MGCWLPDGGGPGSRRGGRRRSRPLDPVARSARLGGQAVVRRATAATTAGEVRAMVRRLPTSLVMALVILFAAAADAVPKPLDAVMASPGKYGVNQDLAWDPPDQV